MGIARAIRRVKRQAKQGGLNAVMSGLGEGLRSRSVPAPLRRAARKIAALIDPTRATKKPRHGAAHSSSGSRSYPDIAPVIARPPAEVTPTGVDSGAEPSEPAEGTPVDAATVGATPTFNATPLEVQPLDASPSEIKPVEVEPVEISLRDLSSLALESTLARPRASVDASAGGRASALAQESEESELTEAASIEGSSGAPAAPQQPKRSFVQKPAADRAGSQGHAKTKSAAKKPAAQAPKAKTPEATKEKLAADGGTAKSLARSGSRAAKKGTSTQAGTTGMKK